MKASEAQVIIDAVKSLVEQNGASRETLAQAPNGAKLVKSADPLAPGYKAPSGDDFERLYLRIKNRLIDECRVDPVLLQLLTQRPEIVIDVEPRILSIDGTTMTGRVARLLAAGWFATPRATGAVRKELARTGTDPGGGGNLSTVLGALKRDGFLTDESGGYVAAPGVKITERDVVAR